jgi:dTDP-4-amino-4,6-dideoxygalactose transaminase
MSDGVPLFEFAPEAGVWQALRDAADRVIGSRRYVLDREVSAFEAEFAGYCGARHCAGVANGTDALELALRAAGVAAGSRVATVANAGYYTCAALAALGASPVFVDIDETLTMCPAELAKAVGTVDAIVVTHLYGRLAAIEPIVATAAAAGVPVIEDCAHAHGAQRDGRRAGSFGAAGCFSFYPTKNLGALGDGGAVVTSDPALHARVLALRQYGWSSKYKVELAGGRNSRLDELQAALLRVKLRSLERWNDARRDIARRYIEGLRGAGVALPDVRASEHVVHLFVVRSRQRDALEADLQAQGIGCAVHYPIPDYRQPVLAASTAHPALPFTESACNEVLTLPCHPGLADADVQRVIDAVRRHHRG